LNGLPEEIKNHLRSKVQFRIGFGEEEVYTPDNSNMRETKGVLTITYRGTRELSMYGDMTW
jgi:hypothetical protein